jgi:hypothetical protein
MWCPSTFRTAEFLHMGSAVRYVNADNAVAESLFSSLNNEF